MVDNSVVAFCVQQSEIKSGYLYIWIANGDDPKVVRKSNDGLYLLESGDFSSEAWDLSIEMSGCFFGPISLAGVDFGDLIPDFDD